MITKYVCGCWESDFSTEFCKKHAEEAEKWAGVCAEDFEEK